PVYEAFMLPGANTFAIPLLHGKEALRLYQPDVITLAALGVILFQVCANLAYFLVEAKPKRGPAWRTEIMSRSVSRLLGYGMLITTLYTVVVQFADWIPNDIGPEVRAVCSGVGIVAAFVQSRRWGEGQLPYYDKIIFVVQLLLQVVFNWVALFLVQGVTILLLSLIGYVSGSRRIPILPIIICLPIIGILYNGKAQMRAKYWNSTATAVTIPDVPGFFSEWIGDGLNTDQDPDAAKSAGVLDRTSLIQIICLVVKISPNEKPFLNGETYLQIPGQFVPRFFWKDKPLGHISTYTLTLYYGLQGSMEEAQQTTIGFGMVAESYANFGFFGMAAIGLFFGTVFKKASGWASQSPIFSYPGLFLVVLMAWTFQTELPLSAWLASLWQATLSVLGLPLLLRNFFK
ncbi:MAG TPA: hypothetical protein VHV47_12255, partial [Opitutaceae bacterium]|nr:hypothetical protein [Opitutaceae bacterium]